MNMKEKLELLGKNSIVLKIAKKEKYKLGAVCDAITAAQFADAPRIEAADRITLYEEDRVLGYFGGGYLYATPDRQEPFL